MRFRALSGSTPQSVNESPELRAIAINEMITAAPILEVAEFYTHTGNADAPRIGAAATGGASRTLDNDFTGVTTTPTFGSIAPSIIGDKIKTDRAHVRRGGDIGDERVRQLIKFSQSLGRYFTDLFINGDRVGDPTVFSGLKTVLTSGYQIKLNGADNGFAVILGNSDTAKKSQQIFKMYIDQLVAEVDGGPSFLMAAPKTLGYLSAIGMEFVRGASIADVFNNAGNRIIGNYFGVPVFSAGYNKDKSALVIGYAETLGTSTDCTSIYAGHFAEKEDLTLATNVGLEVKDLGLVGVHYTTSVELDVDLALLSSGAARRLVGIRLG